MPDISTLSPVDGNGIIQPDITLPIPDIPQEMPTLPPIGAVVQVAGPDEMQYVHHGQAAPLLGTVQANVPLNAVRIMNGDIILFEDEDVSTAGFNLGVYAVDTVREKFWRNAMDVVTLEIYAAAVAPGETAKAPYTYDNVGELQVEIRPKQEDALGSGTGLHLEINEFEDGVAGKRLLFATQLGEIDYDFTSQRAIGGVPINDVQMTFSGWIQPKVDGIMYLRVRANDGVRLKLGNETLIDEWQDSPAESRHSGRGGIRVRGGDKIEITLTHYSAGPGKELRLYWQIGEEWEIVPAKYLYPLGDAVLSPEAQQYAIADYDLEDIEIAALSRVAYHEDNPLVKDALETDKRLVFMFEGAGRQRPVGNSLHYQGRLGALVFNIDVGEVKSVARTATSLPDLPILSLTLMEGAYTLRYDGDLYIEGSRAIIYLSGVCSHCGTDMGSHLAWHSCAADFGRFYLQPMPDDWPKVHDEQALWIDPDEYDELCGMMEDGEVAVLVVDRNLTDAKRQDYLGLYDRAGLELIRSGN